MVIPKPKYTLSWPIRPASEMYNVSESKPDQVCIVSREGC